MSEFFDLDGNQWHHARCDELIAKYQGHKEASSRGGKKRAANAAKKQGALKGTSATAQATNNQEPITNTVQPKKVERMGKKPAAFVPPDTSEVIEFFRVEKLNGDPEHFYDHFENCNWKLSNGRGSKMKNWRLAAKNWSRNQAIFDPKSGGHKNGKLVLPKNRDGWQQFAEIHSLPLPRSGESYDSWQGRMQSEIEKRSNH
jgi:hypothetical protein